MQYEAHVYQSPKLEAVLADIVAFFAQTPLLALREPEGFPGSGAYGLYYRGGFTIYRGHPRTRPIYVGKAVPSGWRQGRQPRDTDPQLCLRLAEHLRSIEQAQNLDGDDFLCRFVIMPGPATDLIASVENALIRRYQPVWNSVIDGFGIHHPGGGRYAQAPSEWDTLHPGRPWVKRLTGTPADHDALVAKVRQHIRTLGRSP